MVTAYHLDVVPARHKRKGTPMRSPCRRDMVESPGVVFRFPDKISSLTGTPATAANASSDLNQSSIQSTAPPGLNILPSAAGLPDGFGAKTAAAVIAAAAAPTAAIPIHRSASNVLHYPELLSDLRDKLIQIHQSNHLNNHSSSGVDSDANSTNHVRPADGPSTKRQRIKRSGRASTAEGNATAIPHYHSTSGTRRSGLRGGSGHNASASSPGLGSSKDSKVASVPMRSSARSKSVLSAASAIRDLESSTMPGTSSADMASASPFYRRHSIATVHTRIEEDEDEDNDAEEEEEELVDIDDEDDSASTTSSIPAAGASAAAFYRQTSAKHAAGPAKNRAPASLKRKREKNLGDRRSGSPAKRADHHASASTTAAAYTGGGRRCCASCAAFSTPCWRPGWIDSMTLCNSCGLRYKKGKVFCAACCYVPMKTEIATGGAIVCKRCSSNIQTASDRPATSSGSALEHQLHRLQ
ncbi:DNA-binding transcription repressor [Dipsacomyces acuminosporus]|nr:DNA-binding transcription repressor [Dipsacomyces acuminosporus]